MSSLLHLAVFSAVEPGRGNNTFWADRGKRVRSTDGVMGRHLNLYAHFYLQKQAKIAICHANVFLSPHIYSSRSYFDKKKKKKKSRFEDVLITMSKISRTLSWLNKTTYHIHL